MRHTLILKTLILVLCPLLFGAETSMSVTAVDLAQASGVTTVTIHCSATPNISSFFQAEPPTVVVDLVGARCAVGEALPGTVSDPVTEIQVNQWRADPMITRVAIELSRPAQYRIERVGNEVQVNFAPVATSRPGELTRESPVPALYDNAETESSAAPDLVTMIVKEADVGAVLQLLASQFKLNILTTADVKGSVTFQFSNVPLQAALDALVKSAGCNMVRMGDVILVKPLKVEVLGELETRIFNLDYAEAADIKASVNKLASPKGDIELSYRRVGDAGASRRASLLVVTDYPDNLNRIERLIHQLDQPVPQIAIEAKFIETTLSNDNLYGLDWALHSTAGGKVPPLTFSAGADVTLPIRLSDILLGTINLGDLAVVLDLLKTRGNSRLLANPRAITLDNHTATMTISTEVPLREVRIDPGTQAQTITWKRQSIPISLTVTPHVLADGAIDMDVNPKVEAITGYVGSATDRQPITARREATAQIRVRDGEVAVLGGLVKDDYSKTVSKVPVLGSIPILGNLLFTKTRITASKTDLLIFIIPHVLSTQ